MPASRPSLHALAGAYALDALGEAEQRRFARHLRRCPSCADEVRGFREVATALAFAAAAEPPTELLEQVMTAAGRTRQLPPESPPRRRFPGWRPRVPASGWLPRLATATAAVAIAAVVVLSIVLSGTVQQLNSARAQGQAIAAVLAAPDVATVTGPVATGGVATVLVSAGKRELVVTASGLAALPAGKVYELWLIGPYATQPTAIRRAGLMPAATAGVTAPVLASGLVAGDKLGMTVEPAGGTNQPTTTPILLLSLPART
jgi:Anti-sigma-K factor rskA, C-terminal/Anti-sigma-K factor RskA, N-terminal domain